MTRNTGTVARGLGFAGWFSSAFLGCASEWVLRLALPLYRTYVPTPGAGKRWRFPSRLMSESSIRRCLCTAIWRHQKRVTPFYGVPIGVPISFCENKITVNIRPIAMNMYYSLVYPGVRSRPHTRKAPRSKDLGLF